MKQTELRKVERWVDGHWLGVRLSSVCNVDTFRFPDEDKEKHYKAISHPYIQQGIWAITAEEIKIGSTVVSPRQY
jgi:hypothetical protein